MRWRTVSFVLFATAALGMPRLTLGEEAPEAGGNPSVERPEKGDGPRLPPLTEEMKAKLLAEFDVDGDGQLSDTEKTSMHEALAKRRSELKAKVPAEFDTNGDGQLSDEEKTAMKETLAQRRAERKAADVSRREANRKEHIAKFDTNGDGKLTGEEAEKARAAKRGVRDGGGEVAAEGRGRGPGGPGGRVGGGSGLNAETKARMVQQFDADGDGKLQGAELEQARQAASKFQAMQRQGQLRGGPGVGTGGGQGKGGPRGAGGANPGGPGGGGKGAGGGGPRR